MIQTFRSILISVAAVFAAAAPAAAAPTTVGVPTTGGGNCYPFGCNSVSDGAVEDVDYYQIYSASAFAGPTTFNTLNFQDSGLNFSAFTSSPITPDLIAGDYTISFSTTLASLGSAFPVAPLANTQTFFSGALAASADYSGFSIAGADYSYDPSQGNLVMEVIASNQAPTANTGANGYVQEDRSGLTTTRAFDEVGNDTVSSPDALVTTFSEGPLSALPETATWIMMTCGVGAIGGMMRRANRQSPKGVAIDRRAVAA